MDAPPRAVTSALHPAAWWGWALGLAVAATTTTNPLLLGLLLAVAGYVVVSRRTDAPWALSFRLYLALGAFIVVMRLGYRVLFGGGDGTTVLLGLPEVPLPTWTTGVRLLGAVTAESLLAGLYDGLRLAAMVVCVGAANALANPKRLLKSMPPALHEVCTAVVVAVSVLPQLVESLQRVRRARRLRGGPRGGLWQLPRSLRAVVVPVLADALDRSLSLAASMDSRGYGRHGDVARHDLVLTSVLLVAGLLGLCAGVYGTLDTQAPGALGTPMLAVGATVAAAGFLLSGRRVRRTRYRPDRFGAGEASVLVSGVAAAVAFLVTVRTDPAALHPPVSPPTWPSLPALPAVGAVIAALPGLAGPRRGRR